MFNGGYRIACVLDGVPRIGYGSLLLSKEVTGLLGSCVGKSALLAYDATRLLGSGVRDLLLLFLLLGLSSSELDSE